MGGDVKAELQAYSEKHRVQDLLEVRRCPVVAAWLAFPVCPLCLVSGAGAVASALFICFTALPAPTHLPAPCSLPPAAGPDLPPAVRAAC